jgi:16S rRNA (cytosine967-C5)-methyltransferase
MSHPEWLVARWLERYPFDEVERWCQFNNTAPPVTVRSAGRMSTDELLRLLRDVQPDAEPSPWVPDAIRLPAGTLGRLPPELREACAVHDEGAQLIGKLAGAKPGERVLDVCAAPGGKSLVMAADMALREHAATSLLVAADYRAPRVRLLRDLLAAAEAPVPVVRLDARQALPFSRAFDVVLLDAPCSGLGTLRRDPDLKWTRRPQDLGGLVREQQQMLAQAAGAVRSGGRLIYATCSSEPEENAAVVAHFLTTTSGFTRVSAAARYERAEALVDADGQVVTLPFRDRLDAFFAAVLVRSEGA